MAARHYLSGVSSLLILRLLEEQELYGYQIIKQLEQRSQNVFSYQAGSLYPVLYRMEKDGLIRHTEREDEHQKRRVYYSITPAGKKQLAAELKEWQQFAAGVDGVLKPMKGVI